MTLFKYNYSERKKYEFCGWVILIFFAELIFVVNNFCQKLIDVQIYDESRQICEFLRLKDLQALVKTICCFSYFQTIFFSFFVRFCSIYSGLSLSRLWIFWLSDSDIFSELIFVIDTQNRDKGQRTKIDIEKVRDIKRKIA